MKKKHQKTVESYQKSLEFIFKKIYDESTKIFTTYVISSPKIHQFNIQTRKNMLLSDILSRACQKTETLVPVICTANYIIIVVIRILQEELELISMTENLTFQDSTLQRFKK